MCAFFDGVWGPGQRRAIVWGPLPYTLKSPPPPSSKEEIPKGEQHLQLYHPVVTQSARLLSLTVHLPLSQTERAPTGSAALLNSNLASSAQKNIILWAPHHISALKPQSLMLCSNAKILSPPSVLTLLLISYFKITLEISHKSSPAIPFLLL